MKDYFEEFTKRFVLNKSKHIAFFIFIFLAVFSISIAVVYPISNLISNDSENNVINNIFDENQINDANTSNSLSNDNFSTPVEKENIIKKEEEEYSTITEKYDVSSGITLVDQNGDKILYSIASVNVRSQPSMGDNVIGWKLKGDEINIIGESDNSFWYQIDFDGQVAYVYKDWFNSKTE